VSGLLARLTGRRPAPPALAADVAPGRYVLRGRAGPVAVGWNAEWGAYTAVPLSGTDTDRDETWSAATVQQLAEHVGSIPTGVARALQHDATMFPHRDQLDMPAYDPVEVEAPDAASMSPEPPSLCRAGTDAEADTGEATPTRAPLNPTQPDAAPESVSGRSVERDEHWVSMVRALRGDSPFPPASALEFVRSMRAVRDHIHPTLRQALDNGDTAHPNIAERWRGPEGEQFGPRVVDDIDPVATALVMYRALPRDAWGEQAIETVVHACGIDPWSPTGIDAAGEMSLAHAREAQRGIVLDALAQIHDALLDDVDDVDTAIGRVIRLAAAWADHSGTTGPVGPTPLNAAAVQQVPRQSCGPEPRPPAGSPGLDALRRATEAAGDPTGSHAVLAGLDAMRSSSSATRPQTVGVA